MNEQAKKEDEQLAFPVRGNYAIISNGMTLRDYFAAKALQGMLSVAPDAGDIAIAMQQTAAESFSNRARQAYLNADAMLEFRKREKGLDCETTPATPPTV